MKKLILLLLFLIPSFAQTVTDTEITNTNLKESIFYSRIVSGNVVYVGESDATAGGADRTGYSIQARVNTITKAITQANALTPGSSNQVTIFIMDGRTYTETETLPDYVDLILFNATASNITAGTTSSAIYQMGTFPSVNSVFGRTGAVVAATSDYDAIQIDNTPAGGIAATNAQAAIDELDSEKANLLNPTFTSDITVTDSAKFNIVTTSGNITANGQITSYNLYTSGLNPLVRWVDSGGSEFSWQSTGGNFRIYDHTAGAERFVLDASGNITASGAFTMSKDQESDLILNVELIADLDSQAPTLLLNKASGTTATKTIVNDGDVVGKVAFGGYDGDSYENNAFIQSVVNGTPANNSMPLDLEFYTSLTGSPVLAMTIDKNQNITANGVGFYNQTTSPTMGSNQAAIYSKDISGTAEMFVKDEDGNETQLSGNRGKFPSDIESSENYEYVTHKQNVYLGIETYIAENRAIELLQELAWENGLLDTNKYIIKHNFLDESKIENWDDNQELIYQKSLTEVNRFEADSLKYELDLVKYNADSTKYELDLSNYNVAMQDTLINKDSLVAPIKPVKPKFDQVKPELYIKENLPTSLKKQFDKWKDGKKIKKYYLRDKNRKYFKDTK